MPKETGETVVTDTPIHLGLGTDPDDKREVLTIQVYTRMGETRDLTLRVLPSDLGRLARALLSRGYGGQ